MAPRGEEQQGGERGAIDPACVRAPGTREASRSPQLISEHEADIARAHGKERGLSGGSLSENPHRITQGSPTRVLGLAWRKGFLEGRQIREEAAQ